MIDIEEIRQLLKAAKYIEPLGHKYMCFCQECNTISRHNSNLEFAKDRVIKYVPELLNEIERSEHYALFLANQSQ